MPYEAAQKSMKNLSKIKVFEYRDRFFASNIPHLANNEKKLYPKNPDNRKYAKEVLWVY